MGQVPVNANEQLLPVGFSWGAVAGGEKVLPGDSPVDAENVASLFAPRYQEARLKQQGKNFLHFVAKDMALQRTVWIKLLRPERAAELKLRGQLRSAAAQAMLAIHPSIVRTHDVVDVTKTCFFIVQEVVPNACSLHEWMQRNAQAEAQAAVPEILELIDRMSNALETLHRHSLPVDLSPHHILRTKEGTLMLISVGTSAVADPRTPANDYYRLIPPEQSGSIVLGDEQCSQYALAAISYQLLVGEAPTPNPPSPHLVDPVIPVGLSKAIGKALSANPKSRYHTLAKFRAHAKKRRLPTYVFCIILLFVAAAVAIGGYLLSSRLLQ